MNLRKSLHPLFAHSRKRLAWFYWACVVPLDKMNRSNGLGLIPIAIPHLLTIAKDSSLGHGLYTIDPEWTTKRPQLTWAELIIELTSNWLNSQSSTSQIVKQQQNGDKYCGLSSIEISYWIQPSHTSTPQSTGGLRWKQRLAWPDARSRH